MSDPEWRKRKAMLILNYTVLLILLIILNMIISFEVFSPYILLSAVLLIPAGAVSFMRLFFRTGVWRLTHSGADSLDEREIVLTHKAVSFSYGVFTVLSLSFFFIHALLFNSGSGATFFITVPSASFLLYLAHTLPGAYILWKEKYI